MEYFDMINMVIDRIKTVPRCDDGRIRGAFLFVGPRPVYEPVTFTLSVEATPKPLICAVLWADPSSEEDMARVYNGEFTDAFIMESVTLPHDKKFLKDRIMRYPQKKHYTNNQQIDQQADWLSGEDNVS